MVFIKKDLPKGSKQCAFVFIISWFFVLSLDPDFDFDHYTSFPRICSHLYWSYTPVNSTLFVKFTTSAVTPPTDGGNGSSWVAWGIHPTGSDSMGTYPTQLMQLIVLSVDAQGSFAFAVEGNNLSSFGESPVRIVRSQSRFSLRLIESEATFVLPEKSVTVDHVLMFGTGDGEPNLLETKLKIVQSLNLTEAREYVFLRLVDTVSRKFTFEKCSHERRSIWDEYLTPTNLYIAFIYTFLMTVMTVAYVEDDILPWAFWKPFGFGVVYTLLTIMYVALTIKVNGVSKNQGSLLSDLKIHENRRYGFYAAIALFVALHDAVRVKFRREREREKRDWDMQMEARKILIRERRRRMN